MTLKNMNPAARAGADRARDCIAVAANCLPEIVENLADLHKNRSTIIGIDIGVRGALALLSPDGDFIEVADMPTLDDGPKGRPAVNAPLLAELIHKWNAGHAFVELVGARPGEGASGAFAFGRSRGVVEGVLGSAGVPATMIAPASWKRAVGIPPGRDGAKDTARSEAIRRWPSHAGWFARVKDDGRAEAALIAVAGLAKRAKMTGGAA